MIAYQRSRNLLWNEIAGDFVALNPDRGTCFGMADVAADVWRLLDRPRTIAQMTEELTQIYDVDDGACRQHVGELLNEMVREGIAVQLD
nr:PqqD family protein [uncultured Sphingomonas sp.]